MTDKKDVKFGIGIEHEVLLLKGIDGDGNAQTVNTSEIQRKTKAYPYGKKLGDSVIQSGETVRRDFKNPDDTKLGDLHEDSSLGGISEFATGEYKNKTVEEASRMIQDVTAISMDGVNGMQYPFANIYKRKEDGNSSGHKYSEAGSYHVTITLPYTEDTAPEEYVTQMRNFGRRLQWFEPLVVACYAGGRYGSIGDGRGTQQSSDVKGSSKNKRESEGSHRIAKQWGVIGLTNVNEMSLDGRHGRYLESGDELPTFKQDSSDMLVNTDYINRWDSHGGDLRWGDRGSRGIGIGQYSGRDRDSGMEIRFLDSFSDVAIDDVVKTFVYIADNGQEGDTELLAVDSPVWNEATTEIMKEGWNAQLPVSYVDKLRQVSTLPINTKSLQAEDILRQATIELWEKYQNGAISSVMISDNSQPPELFNFSRDAWNYFFTLKMHNDEFLELVLKKVVKNEGTYEEFKKDVTTYMGEDFGLEDAVDILDFLEYNGFVNIIRNEDGSIEKYVKTDKSIDALDAMVTVPKMNVKGEILGKSKKQVEDVKMSQKEIDLLTIEIVKHLKVKDMSQVQLFKAIEPTIPTTNQNKVRYVINKLSPDFIVKLKRKNGQPKTINKSIVVHLKKEPMVLQRRHVPVIKLSQDQGILRAVEAGNRELMDIWRNLDASVDAIASVDLEDKLIKFYEKEEIVFIHSMNNLTKVTYALPNDEDRLIENKNIFISRKFNDGYQVKGFNKEWIFVEDYSFIKKLQVVGTVIFHSRSSKVMDDEFIIKEANTYFQDDEVTFGDFGKIMDMLYDFCAVQIVEMPSGKKLYYTAVNLSTDGQQCRYLTEQYINDKSDEHEGIVSITNRMSDMSYLQATFSITKGAVLENEGQTYFLKTEELNSF